jgi:hypothetical protein
MHRAISDMHRGHDEDDVFVCGCAARFESLFDHRKHVTEMMNNWTRAAVGAELGLDL